MTHEPSLHGTRSTAGRRVCRARDLASGLDVTLIMAGSGGPSDQLHWSMRCSRFAALHHPCIARLIDFGPLGETQRFEAWRAEGVWQGSRDTARRACELSNAFLRAADLSTAAEPMIGSWSGRAVVVPDHAAGLERESAGTAITAGHPDVCGLETIARPAVAAIAEVLGDGSRVEPSALAIWGAPGSGLSCAVRDIARLARLNGLVPIDATIPHAAIWSLVSGRSLLVIDRSDDGASGWRRLLDAGVRCARSHLLLIVAAAEVRRVHSLRLEPVPEAALVGAVRPHAFAVVNRLHVAAAAARARGRPARFAHALWRHAVSVPAVAAPISSRVAERPPQYRAMAVAPARPRPWPVSGDLPALQNRLEAARRALDSGRRITGERMLQGVVGALVRRGAFEEAAAGLLTLARARLRRGQTVAARRALDEGRAQAERSAGRDTLADIALVSAAACLDAGAPHEGETLFRAALATACAAADHERAAAAAEGLSRVLFWRGRFDEAAEQAEAAGCVRCGRQLVRLAAAAARAAVGRGSPDGGQAQAARAVAQAEHLGDAASIAHAMCAAAFAHLAAGDLAAVRRDTARGIQAARAAHDPLRALRLRLMAAESHRREGRDGPATALLSRVVRLPRGSLPATVQVRMSLLRDVLGGADERAAAERIAASTGLRALVLFTQARRDLQGDGHPALSEVLDLLGGAETAADDGEALATVCAKLRAHLRAAGVAVAARHGSRATVVASDGARLDVALAERIGVAEQPVRMQPQGSGAEAGAPIRYGGRVLGSVIARWPVGAACEPVRTSELLKAGAAVAGPALAAVAGRLADPDAVAPGDVLGVSAAIEQVRHAVERAAAAPYPVLVEGESGSGKELVARAIHRRSPRRDRTFCAVNCAALPDDLLEAELFGHVRGAFTGAVADRPGVFEEAHGGTLFLDEVGELSPRAQAKLLRTVQECEVRRVGENLARRVDVRIVAATNRNLRQEAAQGRFRLDLVYRLDVVRITVPPLRERADDIPLLIERFWREAADRVHSRAMLSRATIAALSQYSWPGNVRELQNVVAALAVRAPRRGIVPPAALPPPIVHQAPAPGFRLLDARRSFDEQFVRSALARAGGHRGRAAAELGLSRQGLTKLMARLGIGGADGTLAVDDRRPAETGLGAERDPRRD
jgi:DNA-binding NtrC family response regulator